MSHAGLLEVKTGARPEPLNSADHLPDQKTCRASQLKGQVHTIYNFVQVGEFDFYTQFVVILKSSSKDTFLSYRASFFTGSALKVLSIELVPPNKEK